MLDVNCAREAHSRVDPAVSDKILKLENVETVKVIRLSKPEQGRSHCTLMELRNGK